MPRILALDIGDRRIGVAVSDPTGTLASPFTTITRRDLESDITAVLELAEQQEAVQIVAGMPLSLSGQAGPQAKKVRYVIKALEQRSHVPVKTWDERFSTREAERLLRESGHHPSKERALTDAAAAAVILQGYLDSLRRAANP